MANLGPLLPKSVINRTPSLNRPLQKIGFIELSDLTT